MMKPQRVQKVKLNDKLILVQKHFKIHINFS